MQTFLSQKKKKRYVKISQSTVFKDKEARAYFVHVQEGGGRWFEGGVFLVQSQIADSTSKQYFQ